MGGSIRIRTQIRKWPPCFLSCCSFVSSNLLTAESWCPLSCLRQEPQVTVLLTLRSWGRCGGLRDPSLQLEDNSTGLHATV